ncbi:MAG: DUF4249 family protein, partial [Candidatus Eisenbacteria bacterium]|nr:DUF4249 family protein [Candidatus Eisenbacteria bacterium]
MRETIFWTAACLALAMSAGCSGDTTGPDTEEKIAVFANLYVGQTVTGESSVLVSRVLPILDPYDPDQAAIDDAVVTLRREAAEPETLAAAGRGHYVTDALRIEPRMTYHLEVAIPGRPLIMATTTTPDTLGLLSEPRTVPETMRHAAIPDSFPIVLDSPEPSQILLVDVYCEEAWEDARYLEPFAGHDKPDDSREYGGDNGEPRHIFAYMRYEDLEHFETHRIINFYDAMM